jgi:hypothetical protein
MVVLGTTPTGENEMTTTEKLVSLALRFWNEIEAPSEYDMAALFRALAERDVAAIEAMLEPK